MESDSLIPCVPYRHPIQLLADNPVHITALFDEGAMVSAMSTEVYREVRDRLATGWSPPQRSLRMADGSVVPSVAHWKGTIQLGDRLQEGSFEVFDSKGSWAFLFGKPLLQAFEVVHDYKTDTITLPSKQPCNVLPNSSKTFHWEAFDWKKRETLVGGKSPPPRAVPTRIVDIDTHPSTHTEPFSLLKGSEKQETLTEEASVPKIAKENEELPSGNKQGTLVGGENPPSREVPNLMHFLPECSRIDQESLVDQAVATAEVN